MCLSLQAKILDIMNIQQVIKNKGFTIAQVAAEMPNNRENKKGMSQGSLSTLLNGNPSISLLQNVATIIGVSLSELVADDTDDRVCDSTTNVAVCPHCGKSITIKTTIEK